jgi:hypothetical protein
MRYEKYQQRMRTVKTIKDFLWKFRVRFLSGFAIALALFFTLFSIKGLILDRTKVGATYVYGETLAYDSSAIFGKASYEFAKQGSSDWSPTQPTLAGSYQMRAYCNNNYGGKDYGQIQYFTIEPLSVTAEITQDNVVYGNQPSVSISNLVPGDTLVSYEVDYDDITQATTFCHAKEDAFKITNSDGTDVTASYAITSPKKSIMIAPRTLTIQLTSNTMTYDKTPLTSKGYLITQGELADGDYFDKGPDGDTSLTDVGIVQNTCSDVVIRNKDQQDVTSHYVVSILAGTLSVTKKPLTYQSASGSFVYDGTRHSLDEVTCLYGNSPVSGENPSVVYVTPAANCIKPGTYENEYNLSIVDANGTDRSANYDLTLLKGNITITKRPLLIHPASTLIYEDSDPSFAYTIDPSTPIVSGDVIDVTYNYVDDTHHTFNLKALDKDGKNVSDCYDLQVDDATTVIRKRKLVATSNTLTKVYDGTALNGSFTIDNSQSELAEGTVVSPSSALPSVTNVNAAHPLSYTATLSVYDSTGVDKTDYYAQSVSAGTLTVTSRPLVITLISHSQVYDNTALYSTTPVPSTDYTVAEATSTTGLVSGQTLSVSKYPSITTPSSVEVNAANFTAVIKDASGTDTTANYDVQFKTGVLEITARPLKITSDSVSYAKYFDTLAFETSTITYTASATTTDGKSGLLAGDTLSWTFNQSFVTVGSYVLKDCVTFQILRGNTDVTSCYQIDQQDSSYGTLTISKYLVKVSLSDESLVYDGSEKVRKTSYTSVDYALDLSAIPSGYVAAPVFDGDGVTPGTYHRTLTSLVLTNQALGVVLRYGTINGVTYQDFDVLYTANSYGAITIQKRPLAITFAYTASQSVIYTGESHQPSEFPYTLSSGTDTGLLAGDTLSMTSTDSLIGTANSTSVYPLGAWVGSTITAKVLRGSQDVTDYYDISASGNGLVETATLTLTVHDFLHSDQPDGTYSSSDTTKTFPCDISGTNFDYLSAFSIVVTFSPRTTGDTTSPSDVHLVAKDGTVIPQSQITLTVNAGQLTARTPIYLTFAGSHVYDEKALDLNANTSSAYWSYSGTNQLSSGQSFVFSYPKEIKEAGTYDFSDTANPLTATVKDTRGIDRSEDYDIHISGSLTIGRAKLAFNRNNITLGYSGSSTLAYSQDFTQDSSPALLSLNTGSSLYLTGLTVAYSYHATASIASYGTPYAYTISSLTASLTESDGTVIPDKDIDKEYLDTGGTITLVKRAITIDIPYQTIAYQGSAMAYSELSYTVSGTGLASGDSLSLSGSLSNFGTYSGDSLTALLTSGLSPVITTADGTDVTSFYTITLTGSFTYNRLQIALNLPLTSKVYDGTTWYPYTATMTLLGAKDATTGGCTLAVNEVGLLSPAAKTYALSDFTLTVTNKDKQVLSSSCYDVVLNTNPTSLATTATVTKRALALDFHNDVDFYDGVVTNAQKLGEYAYNNVSANTTADHGLAPGDTLSFSYSKTIQAIGTYDLSTMQVNVKNSNNEDVTGCYDITMINATLTIVQGEVDVTVTGNTSVYDGQKHQATVTATPNFSLTTSRQSMTLTAAPYTFLVDSGTIALSIDDILLHFDDMPYNGAAVKTGYYRLGSDLRYNSSLINVVCTVSTQYPNLTVSPKPITMSITDTTRAYLGTPYTLSQLTSSASLVTSTQTYTLSSTATFEDPGVYDFSTATYRPTIVITESADTYNLHQGKAYDATSNYTVSFTGKLTIVRLAVTATDPGHSKTYDGTLFSDTDVTLACSNLPADYTFSSISLTTASYHAGSYTSDHLTLSFKLSFAGTEVSFATTDLSLYCDITINANLTINKKTITLTPGARTAIYNGSPVIYTKVLNDLTDVVLPQLGTGDQLGFSAYPVSPFSAEGTYDLSTAAYKPVFTVHHSLTGGTQDDVTDSYDFVVTGTITVVKATVELGGQGRYTYGGSTISMGANVTATNLPATYSISGTLSTFSTEAGWYYSNSLVPSVVVKDETGTALDSKYVTVTVNTNASIEILKRSATIATSSFSLVYTGAPITLSTSQNYFHITGLLPGTTLKYKMTDGTIDDVNNHLSQQSLISEGSYGNTIVDDTSKLILVNSDGKDVTNDYQITWKWGTITIEG